MRHAFLDEYSYLDSPLRRIPIGIKIIGLAVFVILAAVTPIQLFYLFVVYFILIFSLIFISKVPFRFFGKRLISISPFILLVAVSLPFIRKDGWVVLANSVAKAILISLSIILVMATTNFSHFLNGLKELKFPTLIITLLSFMYRYIFILEDEFLRRRRALECRDVGNKKWAKIKSLANMLGLLFITTYERAERIYLAMCARGYNGE